VSLEPVDQSVAPDVAWTDPTLTGGELVPVPRPPVQDDDGLRRGDVDGWGRSERMRAVARRLYDPIYRRWFRAEWEGLEHIPSEGGALLVGNHGGAIPSDAPVVIHGIETELGRPVYGMADNLFRLVPVVGTLWSRTGGVPAHPENAYRLLHDEQQLALIFPEGTKGTGKLARDRYQLRRFGRGGFVETAMRAGVPVVPLAIIGNEEAMPIVYKASRLARLMNLPYFPVTANQFVFGPVLGLVVPLPSKFRIRVLPPVFFDAAPNQEPVQPQPGDGVRGADPHPDPRGGLRDAAQPPQRVVRLMRILVTGLGTFWGSKVAQRLEQEPGVELVVGVDTQEPVVPLERTEYVRADSSFSILERIVRATKGGHDPAHPPDRRLDEGQRPGVARDQRHRDHEPARGGGRGGQHDPEGGAAERHVGVRLELRRPVLLPGDDASLPRAEDPRRAFLARGGLGGR